MNYQKRLETVQKAMAKKGYDGFFLAMSSDLQYLTGVLRQPHNPTDDDKHGDELYGAFITPEQGPIFLAPRMGASEYVQSQAEDKPWIEDIVVIDDGDDLDKVTRDILKKVGNPKRLAVNDRLWARSMFRFRQTDNSMEFGNASEIIAPLRAVKDEHELALMREAGSRTDQIFGAVIKQIRLGMTAYDIAREVNHQMVLHGCTAGPSFHTGVYVNGEGLRKHTTPDGRSVTPVQPGAVVTFDFGVIYKGYVSDFGRTVFVETISDKYQKFHDLVMESQAQAIAAMKCGQVSAAELNRIARKVIEDGGYGEYFTHRLGHGIGIDVHEPPFLYEQDDTVLATGMCFTIEPSIMETAEIRVEDVVQVTEHGGVALTDFSRDYLVI